MGPGNGIRWFFFTDSARITEWHSEKCPQTDWTSEEILAGYKDISKEYGFLLSLRSITRGDITKNSEIMDKSVYEVYIAIQIEANLQAADRKLAERRRQNAERQAKRR